MLNMAGPNAIPDFLVAKQLTMPVSDNFIVVGMPYPEIQNFERAVVDSIVLRRTEVAGEVNHLAVSVRIGKASLIGFGREPGMFYEPEGAGSIDRIFTTFGPNGATAWVHRDLTPSQWTRVPDTERMMRGPTGEPVVVSWPELIFDSTMKLVQNVVDGAQTNR